MFRIDDVTGQPVSTGTVDILGVTTLAWGVEGIEYQMLDQNTGQVATLAAEIFRDPQNPDVIEVALVAPIDGGGWYKMAY